MRKSVLVVTTVFAIASSSAFALGDRAKEKKPASSATPSTQATENPSGSGAPNTTKGMSSTPSSTSAPTPGSSTSSANVDKDRQSQVAQNDSRCDASKYASKSAMPKECVDKAGTGASAVGSTQGQSGGASSSSSK